jgi:hypothetical protein
VVLGCARPVQRSLMYSSGPETLVPLCPTHGLSLCTWRHYKKLIMTSVSNQHLSEATPWFQAHVKQDFTPLAAASLPRARVAHVSCGARQVRTRPTEPHGADHGIAVQHRSKPGARHRLHRRRVGPTAPRACPGSPGAMREPDPADRCGPEEPCNRHPRGPKQTKVCPSSRDAPLRARSQPRTQVKA